MNKLITGAELAERFGVPERTLADWRSRRIGPAYVRLGRYCRYRLEDVERYEDSRHVDLAAQPPDRT